MCRRKSSSLQRLISFQAIHTYQESTFRHKTVQTVHEQWHTVGSNDLSRQNERRITRCGRSKFSFFSEKIPLALLHKYLDKGHRLFVDNYYTSTQLAQYLLDRETKLVGTVRPTRRNFPHELARADIGRGETKFAATNSGILAWYTSIGPKTTGQTTSRKLSAY